MALNDLHMAVNVTFEKNGQTFRFSKRGSFNVNGTEVKTGVTTVDTGANITILTPNDLLVLDRALFVGYNDGDGNLIITTYAAGAAISAAEMTIRPGEIALFRLPNSTNAADKLTATLASGSLGRIVWMVVEDDPTI